MQTNSKTPEVIIFDANWLRSFSSFEEVSEAEAQQIIISLVSLGEILFRFINNSKEELIDSQYVVYLEEPKIAA